MVRKITIPKRNGKTRMIYIPSRAERAALRALLPDLERRSRKQDRLDVAHGFRHGRSPVTNASAHVGHAYTVTMDLQDCFDSIGARHLSALPKSVLERCLVDGAPRQGLPTSPALCNLALAPMDVAITRWRDKGKIQFVYTRYADDLTLSCDDRDVVDAILVEVPKIVARCGFRVATHKTKVLHTSSGRRRITGVAVSDTGVHPTRETKRRLRAARHQAARGIPGADQMARGLAEWAACRPPRERGCVQADDLAKAWKLPARAVEQAVRACAEKRHDEVLSENPRIVITRDPVYILGMSTVTTGWRSCMACPLGQYHLGVVSWCLLKGTRVAALLSERHTHHVPGVGERPAMIARCLVHDLRDGRHVHDRVYPGGPESAPLTAALRTAGYVHVRDAVGGTVVGNTPHGRRRPYCDSLRTVKGTVTRSGKTRSVWIYHTK